MEDNKVFLIEFNSVNFAIVSEARKCATYEENLQMKILFVKNNNRDILFKQRKLLKVLLWIRYASLSMDGHLKLC